LSIDSNIGGPDDPGELIDPTAEQKSCPSRQCEPGSQLLGVMMPSGQLAYLQPPTVVDVEFVSTERRRGHPERRFRFTGPCVEGRCPQWTGSRCAVADVVVQEHVAVAAPTSRLPVCSIRSTCRWFSQNGKAACMACPSVVADCGGTGTYSELIERIPRSR
jgi:hypothetical protein